MEGTLSLMQMYGSRLYDVNASILRHGDGPTPKRLVSEERYAMFLSNISAADYDVIVGLASFLFQIPTSVVLADSLNPSEWTTVNYGRKDGIHADDHADIALIIGNATHFDAIVDSAAMRPHIPDEELLAVTLREIHAGRYKGPHIWSRIFPGCNADAAGMFMHSITLSGVWDFERQLNLAQLRFWMKLVWQTFRNSTSMPVCFFENVSVNDPNPTGTVVELLRAALAEHGSRQDMLLPLLVGRRRLVVFLLRLDKVICFCTSRSRAVIDLERIISQVLKQVRPRVVSNYCVEVAMSAPITDDECLSSVALMCNVLERLHRFPNLPAEVRSVYPYLMMLLM